MGRGLSLQYAVNNFGNIGIPLVDDNGFGIVIQFIFAVLDMAFQMAHGFGIQLQGAGGIFVPFEYFDGIPAQESVLHLRRNGFFDMGYGMLHAAGEYGRQVNCPLRFRRGHRLFCRFHAALSLEGGNFHHFTAQFFRHLFHINGIPVLFHQVHHVHCHHHRQSDFNKLGGKIEVSFQVRAIDDVQNGIRLFIDQVVSGHLFFHGVGRKGINTGQILDDHIFVSLQDAVLLFYCNAGPVSHILGTAGEFIK